MLLVEGRSRCYNVGSRSFTVSRSNFWRSFGATFVCRSCKSFVAAVLHAIWITMSENVTP